MSGASSAAKSIRVVSPLALIKRRTISGMHMPDRWVGILSGLARLTGLCVSRARASPFSAPHSHSSNLRAGNEVGGLLLNASDVTVLPSLVFKPGQVLVHHTAHYSTRDGQPTSTAPFNGPARPTCKSAVSGRLLLPHSFSLRCNMP